MLNKNQDLTGKATPRFGINAFQDLLTELVTLEETKRAAINRLLLAAEIEINNLPVRDTVQYNELKDVLVNIQVYTEETVSGFWGVQDLINNIIRELDRIDSHKHI